MILTKPQMAAWRYLHDLVTNEVLFGGGAGGGKSKLGCDWLIEMCGLYPGTRWLMGRAELEQLKKTTLVTFFESCDKLGLKANKDFIYNAQDKLITFVQGGSQILLYDLAHYPSDPNYDRLGSLEITGGFVDEVGQISFKCWETVRSRIRYKLDKYGLIPKLLGSCNPVKSWPYGEFYRPFIENRLPSHRQFIRALVTDNPFISPHYIASLRSMKDKAQKERLLFGNWEYDDDPSALFPIEVIADLFTTEAQRGQKYLIGDVSRQGRDRMIIGLWDGWQCYKIIEIPYEVRQSTLESAKFVMRLAVEHVVRRSHILLDEDGVGGGVVDNIPGCLGFVNNSSPIITEEEKQQAKETGQIINFANLKSQCSYVMAEKSAQGLIGVTCEPDIQQLLTEELEQIKRKDADKDGKVAVVGKEKIKEAIGRSPDIADMFMMRARFALTFQSAPEMAFSVSLLSAYDNSTSTENLRNLQF